MSPVRRPPRRRRPDCLQHGRGVAAGVPSRRSNWTAGCSLNFEARLHQLLGAIPYLEGGLSNLRFPVLNAHAVPYLLPETRSMNIKVSNSFSTMRPHRVGLALRSRLSGGVPTRTPAYPRNGPEMVASRNCSRPALRHDHS